MSTPWYATFILKGSLHQIACYQSWEKGRIEKVKDLLKISHYRSEGEKTKMMEIPGALILWSSREVSKLWHARCRWCPRWWCSRDTYYATGLAAGLCCCGSCKEPKSLTRVTVAKQASGVCGDRHCQLIPGPCSMQREVRLPGSWCHLPSVVFYWHSSFQHSAEQRDICLGLKVKILLEWGL